MGRKTRDEGPISEDEFEAKMHVKHHAACLYGPVMYTFGHVSEQKELTRMQFETPELDGQEQEVVGRILEARNRLRLQLVQPRRWFGNLRRLSMAKAIQGSNSIEGFVAALDDVAAIEAGEEPLDADTETRLALWGYREAMTYVLQLAGEETFDYSEQLLKSLHFMMTSYDLGIRPGLWRKGEIFVHNEETDEVVYEGPDVRLVPGLMAELVSALNQQDETLPEIIRASMAHLNLVMVHPFRDGNGRMARCLQTLVLAREGILDPAFCSIEEYLGRNTDDYYEVLSEVGRGSWHPENDARPWVQFSLKAHFQQAETLLRRIQESEQLWIALEHITEREGLPDRTIDAMWDAAIGLRVRRSTYFVMIEPDLSEQAAGRDLRQLAERSLLVPHGEKRGRYYTGSDELVNIWRGIRAKRAARPADPFAA
jgi:Fic family protein